eukprot:GFUD01033209.1.p1 GENE.GFUD01033209.1~~GFUD01033209.1.p1  ORF type:complete len:134 (-),score=27.10 GFUD01033209.1:46-447(-)
MLQLLQVLCLVCLTRFPLSLSQQSSAASEDALNNCDVVPEGEMTESYKLECFYEYFDLILDDDDSQVYSRQERIVNTKGSARNQKPPRYSSSSSSGHSFNTGSSQASSRTDEIPIMEEIFDEIYDFVSSLFEK